MDQYFTRQTTSNFLLFMLVVTPEGSDQEQLQIIKIGRDEMKTLGETHEFVRMSGNVIPIFKKV